MTIRFNQQGYQPTKKERIEHNMDNFDRKVGKLLDYYNAGEISDCLLYTSPSPRD